MAQQQMTPIMLPRELSDHTSSSRMHITAPVYLTVPMAMFEAHAKQAEHNHSQTPQRLAERGGVSACEACAILEDRDWSRMSDNDAYKRLAELVAKASIQEK